MMKYILLTNKPDIAAFAENCGVHRIFIDLERHGKLERQGHLDTVISLHSFDDISSVKSVLHTSELLVRINPFYEGTESEINTAIENGADIIMLPMIKSLEDVAATGNLINGRAKFMPLIETVASLECIREIDALPVVDELHIGLNDLHLEMKLDFMFQLFPLGVMEKSTKGLRKPFGIGGVSRANDGLVKGKNVIGEHVRLGSTGVILARAFHEKSQTLDELKSKLDLEKELGDLDACVKEFMSYSDEQLCENSEVLARDVQSVVRTKNNI